MKDIGTEVAFEFSLYRASHRDPVEMRTGKGIVVSNADYSVWPCPGYAIRVTESPNYKAGEIVHCTTTSLRPVAS